MAESNELRLRRFFQRYATACQQGDMELIAGAHADRFIETARDRFAAWKVDSGYREQVTERHRQMREELGLSGLEVDLTGIHEIAPFHYLAEARWRMAFDRAEEGPARSEFTVSYIVRTVNDPCILAHLPHEQRDAAVRCDGVI